jgi:hypothetical protein
MFWCNFALQRTTTVIRRSFPVQRADLADRDFRFKGKRMPTAAAVRRKKPEPVILDPQTAPDSAIPKPVRDNATLFNPFDEALPFFDALAMITEHEWPRYLLYLYRLDPRVRNPEGEPSYIDKYQRAIDEGEIRATHGGGKYMLILKDDVMQKGGENSAPPRERRYTKCRIAGEPRLQSGQTTMQPVNAEVAPAADTGAQTSRIGSTDVAVLADVLRDALRDRRPSADGADLMAESYKKSLTIVSESASMAAKSATGSALGDKLLEKLLDSELGGKKHSGDSDLRDKLALIAIERLQNPPITGGELKDPLGQLTFIKELTGVDNLRDLLLGGRGGGDEWKSKLIEMGVSLVSGLPQLFQLYVANQDRMFQRQLQLEQIRRSGQLPPIAPTPGAPIAAAVPNTQVETAGEGSPTEVPMNIFNPAQMALDEIAVDFEQGLDGQLTARLVRQRYAQVVESMKPMLANAELVKQFAINTPPLSEIAGDDEFPEFLEQFVNEILHPEEEKASEGEDTGGPATA